MIELLAKKGIDTALLMPKNQVEGAAPDILLNKDPENPAPFPAFLPLHVFDNKEYDCRTPQDWLQMGQENGVRKPVPGKALLPTSDDVHHCECVAKTQNFSFGLWYFGACTHTHTHRLLRNSLFVDLCSLCSGSKRPVN